MVETEPLTAYQPFKAVFVAASLLYCFLVRLPTLGLYFVLASNRPDPTWSWKQAIGITTCRFLFNMAARARFARVFAVDRTPKDPKKFIVPGITQDKLDGVLSDPNVKPADFMAEWYPTAFDMINDIKQDTKVILFMFGGAYVMGNAKPEYYTGTLKRLCPAINGKFLIIAYRLAGSAGGQPFPSQLQDLLSAYQHLLNIGVASKNIILVGESAGGNAVVSFLRYLEDCGPEFKLPLPSAALLSSPWIDLTPDPWLRPQDPRYKTDFAAVRLVIWGQKAFIPCNRTASDIYISPALKAFHSRVPIWIEAGTGEVVFDALQKFAEDMQNAGTDIELFRVAHGTHAHMWAAGLIGFDPNESIDSFVAFTKRRGL